MSNGYLIDSGLNRDTVLDLVDRVTALEASVAATQTSIAATNTADREVFVSPMYSTSWTFRTGNARDAGVLSTSKGDEIEWIWEELKMGFLTNAVIRITDTAGKAGLPVTVHWRAGGAGPTLLASATSAGDGTTQDLTLNFSNAVEGPGIFIFGATTPSPLGAPGTYQILRCRVRA